MEEVLSGCGGGGGGGGQWLVEAALIVMHEAGLREAVRASSRGPLHAVDGSRVTAHSSLHKGSGTVLFI